MHERAGPFADVAADALDARVRCILPSGELRFIGVWHVCPQNFGDSIEWSDPYPATRRMTTLTAVSARMTSVVRRTSGARSREPAACRRRISQELPALQPDAQRDQQQAEQKDGGERDDNDQPRIRGD